MFLVFDDVQRGVYKRSSLSATTGAEKKSKPEMHIEGPLEIKGRLVFSLYSLLFKVSSVSFHHCVCQFYRCRSLITPQRWVLISPFKTHTVDKMNGFSLNPYLVIWGNVREQNKFLKHKYSKQAVDSTKGWIHCINILV